MPKKPKPLKKSTAKRPAKSAAKRPATRTTLPAVRSEASDRKAAARRGFAFMGRQKRITLDGEHFFIDLVFYNRLTRSFVLVDLKVGKLTH